MTTILSRNAAEDDDSNTVRRTGILLIVLTAPPPCCKRMKQNKSVPAKKKTHQYKLIINPHLPFFFYCAEKWAITCRASHKPKVYNGSCRSITCTTLPKPDSWSAILTRRLTNGEKVQKVLQSCFPNLSKLDFEQGDSSYFLFRPTNRVQVDWLTPQQKSALDQVNGKSLPLYDLITNETMHTALQTFRNLLEDPSRPLPPGNISVPFLLSKTLASNYLVDRHYDEIREFLRLNETCCKLLPDPDETVFVSLDSF